MTISTEQRESLVAALDAAQREVNATIKLVLSELEEVAQQDPRQACEPVLYNERRARIIKKIWHAMREVHAHAVRSVQHG